jgi:hypothetical protein
MAEKDWLIDLNGIKAKEKKELNAAIKETQEAGDDLVMVPWFVKVVKKCPYLPEPTDENAYPELGIAELMEVSRRVGEAFRKLTESTV